MKIGFHASHEQFAPSALLDLVVQAQAAGFQAATCSDHFHPWSEAQGQSGFAWSWLGAALQATELPFGVVCAPGQRYHPTVIAQASATLAEMFPGRFWLALGSGQLLNEGITGEGWPPKRMRNERLEECAGIIRSLWAGERVTGYGHILVEDARLYTRPETPPLLIAAALTPETAEWAGGWAGGLITISRPVRELKEVVDAFRKGGGEGKPLFLKAQISYAADDESAMRGAWEQWRTNIFESPVLSDLRLPEQFAAAARFVTRDDLHGHVRISSSAQRHAQWLRQDIDLGFDHIYVHNVNPDQENFIRDFGEQVLPLL